MLKQYTNLIRRSVIFTDICIVVFSFALAYVARRTLITGFFPYGMYFINEYGWVLPLVTLSWVSSLYIMGMYDSLRLKTIPEVLWIILRGGFASFLIFVVAIFIFRYEHIHRWFIFFFFTFTFIIFALTRIGMVIFFRSLRARGFNFRHIVIVGTGRRAQNLIKYLNQHRELGLKIVGIVDEDPAKKGTTVLGHEVFGTLDEMGDILKNNVIDYAIFMTSRSTLNKIEPALLQCELVGVSASVAMDLFELKVTQGKETNFLGVPMLTFERTSHSVVELIIKHFIDIFVASFALLLIAPFYALIAIIIKLSSPGPVYFIQDRVGLNGRIFKLYKFRTMVVDAEEKLKELMEFNEMKGPAFKMENDPRITPIGKFLRKYSLDELPQLWNVFHGDMSLVGPRPPLPREVKQYDPWHQRRLSMRPGITCTWQVGGRSRITDFDQWVKMDLEYIDNWSLKLDFIILCKTIPAVLSASGAK